MNTCGFSCRWDSGQVGFIHVHRTKALEEWGLKPNKWREQAAKYLTGEVETYDSYLTGQVFGYVVFEEDESAYMGPDWLDPWPYPVATVEDDGKLHIRAKAMHIPYAWYIPMPDRFKGVHYCHLVPPAYLQQLLLQ